MMKKEIRVGYDVDGVLGCFSTATIQRAKKMGLGKHFPDTCEQVSSWDMSDEFSQVMKEAWLDEEFWLGIPPLKGSLPLPIAPYVYITSRQISGLITKQWLDNNGFPEAPVITVKTPSEKLEHCKSLNLDVFVDDLYSTVRLLRDNGVNALLYDAPYQVGHLAECEGLPKIYSLEEIKNYV